MTFPDPPAARVIVASLPETVTFTTWSRATNAAGGKPTTTTWQKLADAYRKAGSRVKAKSNLAAPVFATVREQCTPEDCSKAKEDNTTIRRHRCDASVTSVTAIVLDHDECATWEPVVAWLRAHGLAGILYESPRCNLPDDDGIIGPRWRVVIPLHEPADPKPWRIQYGAFRLFLTAQTGIEFDAKCCNPSRIFYPPTRPDEDVPPRIVEWIDGGALDLPATLATLPVAAPEPQSCRRATANASSIYELDDEDRSAFERWCQGAFRGATRAVATAPVHTRNAALNSQTFALLSRFGANNLLDESAIASAMVQAAKSAGLAEPEISKTIDSAHAGARAKPVMMCDLLAEWRKGRKVVPLRPRPTTQNADTEEPPPDDEPEFQPLSSVLDAVKDSRVVCPIGFRIAPTGKRGECQLCRSVSRKGSTEDEVKIAHVPIWIASELTSQSADGNLIDVNAIVDGRKLSRVLSRGLIQDPRKLAIALESGGIALCTGKTIPYDIACYLSSFLHTNRLWLPRKRACARMGWDDARRAFLYGTESVGDDDMVLHTGVHTGAVAAAEAFRAEGDPVKWREVAEAFVTASPAGGLALAAAAASPMLRAFGWPPVGTVLGGLGGTGKTAILTLAGSAFGATGDPSSRQANGVVGNGIATLNALVGQFLPLADLPHLADEVRINAVDPRSRSDTEAALHALIDGQGRSRLRRDSRGTISSECSPGCAVLGTETDPSEFLRKGGAMRRYLCPRPPYGDQLGQYRDALAVNFGHAGRALVHALVACTAARRAELAKLRVTHLETLRAGLAPFQLANESVRTWADQIAVCLAAIDVAHELCPGLWPDADCWRVAVLSAWALILEDPGERSEQGDPVTAAYARTVEWIAQHRAHILPSPSRMRLLERIDGAAQRRSQAVREPVIGRVYSAESEDDSDEVLLVVDLYQSKVVEFLAAAGYSMRTMGKVWAARGYLEAAKNNRTTVKIAGVVTSVYRVKLPEGGEL